MENKEEKNKKFLEALLKTKSGEKAQKHLKKKLSKMPPLTLKALGLAGLISGKIPIKIEKKIDKDKQLMLEGDPKKKSIGLFFKKSF